ncbi:MAG TPA: enoyl-CoA hydratase [Quisquiliibacterium sp.]|nr:enoyl-CoA hydratase [Quisquiliibacterium sp.]
MAARLLVERQGPVLVLTISNPEARNALHPDIYAAGRAALESLAGDASIRAVVLGGEGRVFCAGGNLNRLLENRGRDPAVQMDSIEGFHGFVRAIRACDRPVIAAVEGAAAGGGFSLALSCDQIVAAADAKFVMSYVRIGLTPDGGGSWFLGTRLPFPLAYELLATAAPIEAARLHALGLVNRVTDPGQALAAALEHARRLAEAPAGVLARLKRLADSAPAHSLPAHLERERDNFVESLFHADAGEGITAFLEKRPPRFGGPR